MEHNGLFAECSVLTIFKDFVVQGQGLVHGPKTKTRTRTCKFGPRG